jgi:cytochrome c553
MESGSVVTRIASGILIVGSLMLAAVSAHAKDEMARVHDLVAERCAACHGVDGNSVVSAYPRLAGQYPEYLQQQLEMFKGLDGRPPMRHSPLMEPVVADLSEDDLRALAAYYATQVPSDKGKLIAPSSGLGESVYTAGSVAGSPACAACHGVDGAGVPGVFPRLAGQHPEYLETQLQAYKNGRRGGKGKAMTTIGPLLSDEEINGVATYIGSLKVR